MYCNQLSFYKTGWLCALAIYLRSIRPHWNQMLWIVSLSVLFGNIVFLPIVVLGLACALGDIPAIPRTNAFPISNLGNAIRN